MIEITKIMIAGNCSIYQSFSFMCKIDSIFCTISKWFSIIPQNKVMNIAQIKYICFCFINKANQNHQNAQTKQKTRVAKSGTFRALTFPVSMAMLEITERVNKKSLKLSKFKYWCNRNQGCNY